MPFLTENCQATAEKGGHDKASQFIKFSRLPERGNYCCIYSFQKLQLTNVKLEKCTVSHEFFILFKFLFLQPFCSCVFVVGRCLCLLVVRACLLCSHIRVYPSDITQRSSV